MARKKEKVSLFEKVEFENSSTANEFLVKENKIFYFKLICVILAGIGTIFYALSFKVGSGGILDTVFGVAYLIGLVATVVSGPINVLKMFVKLGKFCYWLVPLWLIDLAAFVFGVLFGVVVFIYFPVVFAIYNLYQSYRNKKEAEKYIALYSGYVSNQNQNNMNTQASNDQQPQSYKCPGCEGEVAYGEANCRNCGMAFKW